MTFMQLKAWTTEAIHNDPGVRIAVERYCMTLIPKIYEEMYRCSFLYRFMLEYLINLPTPYGQAPDREREIKAFFRKYWDDANEKGVEEDYRCFREVYSFLSEADRASDRALANKVGKGLIERARRLSKHFFSLYMKGGRAMRLISAEAGVSETEADAELGTKSDYDFNLVVNPALDPNQTFPLMRSLYEKIDLFLQTKTQDPFFEDDTLNARIERAIAKELVGKLVGEHAITAVSADRVANFGYYNSTVTDEFARESLFTKPFYLIRLGTAHDVGITTTRGPYRPSRREPGYTGHQAVGELIDISFVLRGGSGEAEFDWNCARHAELIARPESIVPDLLEVYDLHSIIEDLKITIRSPTADTAKRPKREKRLAFFEKLLCFSEYGKTRQSEEDWPTCKRVLRTVLCGFANLTDSEQDLLVQETLGLQLDSLTIFDLLYGFHEKWFRASHTKRVFSKGLVEYFYFDSANPRDAHHAAFVRFAGVLRERLLSLRAMDVDAEFCRYYINLVKMLDKGAFNDEQMRRFIIAASAYNIISYVDELVGSDRRRAKRPDEISPDRLTLRLNRAAHDRYEARNAAVSQPIVNAMGRPLMSRLLERLPAESRQLIIVGGYAYEMWQHVLKCCPKERIGQKLVQYIKTPGATPFATNDIDLRLTVNGDVVDAIGEELLEFVRRAPLPPGAPPGSGYEVIRLEEDPGLLQVLYTSRSPLILPGTEAELMWEQAPIFRGVDVVHLVELRCERGVVYTNREVVVGATDRPNLTFGILQLKELLNRFQQVVAEEHQPIRLKKYVDRIVALSKAETRVENDMCVYSGARRKKSPKKSPKKSLKKSPKKSPKKSKRY